MPGMPLGPSVRPFQDIRSGYLWAPWHAKNRPRNDTLVAMRNVVLVASRLNGG
jgi:hypothetical protein